jgi:hypothetical protein
MLTTTADTEFVTMQDPAAVGAIYSAQDDEFN